MVSAPRPAPRRTPPLWQRLLLVVGSPILFVLLAEACVRIAHIDTELARNANFDIAVPVWLLADPGWVLVQDQRMQRPQGVHAADVVWLRNFEEARYIQYRLHRRIDVAAVNPFNEIDVKKQVTFKLTSNDRGFRGPEIAPKRAGVMRIVSFGDSSTFGWGVDLEHTYQELLVDRLVARGIPAESLNFAMPGFTSRHGVNVQKYYASDLEPDLVIIGFAANDGRHGLVSTDDALKADETFVAGVSWRLRSLESYKLLRRAVFSVYDPFRARPSEHPQTMVEAVPLDAYRANLQRMITAAERAGARAALVSICASEEHRTAMAAVAERRGVPMIDAGRLFLDNVEAIKAGRLHADALKRYEERYGRAEMERNWRLFLTSDGCHPHEVGHRLIADALVEAIAAHSPAGP
jgi:lysophospholipase L1-like esterase